MMYLALSYDHRLIDGRESVGFLVAIKELLEDPTVCCWTCSQQAYLTVGRITRVASLSGLQVKDNYTLKDGLNT